MWSAAIGVGRSVLPAIIPIAEKYGATWVGRALAWGAVSGTASQGAREYTKPMWEQYFGQKQTPPLPTKEKKRRKKKTKKSRRRKHE